MGPRRLIPNKLRKFRILAGYKQFEVAKLLGFSCSNRISRWEQGLSVPSLRNLMKLSTLYLVLIEELYLDVLKETRAELDGLNKKNKS